MQIQYNINFKTCWMRDRDYYSLIQHTNNDYYLLKYFGLNWQNKLNPFFCFNSLLYSFFKSVKAVMASEAGEASVVCVAGMTGVADVVGQAEEANEGGISMCTGNY